MREGLTVTAAGVAIGLVMAVEASKFLEALLFGVRPLDASTYGGVTVLFAVVAAIACYLPARRATRVDPVVALRAN
jgi:putative ABC transport system permease protein